MHMIGWVRKWFKMGKKKSLEATSFWVSTSVCESLLYAPNSSSTISLHFFYMSLVCAWWKNMFLLMFKHFPTFLKLKTKACVWHYWLKYTAEGVLCFYILDLISCIIQEIKNCKDKIDLAGIRLSFDGVNQRVRYKINEKLISQNCTIIRQSFLGK